MLSKTFLAQVAERAIKTFAQAAAALLTADGLGLLAVDWTAVASVAGMAAVVSVLTSVASGPVGPGDSPSLVRTVPGPSAEAVRLLSRPVGSELDRKLREAVRKAWPGGLQ